MNQGDLVWEKWGQHMCTTLGHVRLMHLDAVMNLLAHGDTDGLVQEWHNSSAIAMESRLSCTNPSIHSFHIKAVLPLAKGLEQHQIAEVKQRPGPCSKHRMPVCRTANANELAALLGKVWLINYGSIRVRSSNHVYFRYLNFIKIVASIN